MSLAEADDYLRSETYPIVMPPSGFVDERGKITNLTTTGAQSAAIITSKAGSQRASHVHQGDDHLAFVISGRIEYWWQDVRVEHGKVTEYFGEKKKVIVEAGQAFYTPKNVAHTMFFPVDTVFATVSCQARDHANHEADLIRVPSLKETSS